MNDFTYADHCIALWKFESSTLTVDSKNGQTLTNNNGVSEDTVNFKEGLCSANFNAADSEYFTILNANLLSGFPGKGASENQFDEDDNCKAFYRFESGALIVDSKNIYTLSTIGSPTADATHKEGSYSVSLNGSSYVYRIETLVDGTFSICAWIKPQTVGNGHYNTICEQREGSGGQYFTFYLATLEDASAKGRVYFRIFDIDHNNKAAVTTAYSLVIDGAHWYHVTARYNATTKLATLLVWDDTAQGQLAITNPAALTKDMYSASGMYFRIGYGIGSYGKGNIDELVIFNDILSDDEVASVRLSRYGYTGMEEFTFCFWMRPDTFGSEDYYPFMKYGDSLQCSYRLIIDKTSKKMRLALTRNGIDDADYFEHASALICDGTHWYHMAITHNAIDGAIRIRIYDATAGAILGTDKTDTFGYTLNCGTAPFEISSHFVTKYDGLIDEFVVFNDVLSIVQIDAIRNGTFIACDYVTQNAFMLLYDIAISASGCTCDKEDSDFLLENAIEDYDRPFKRFHSNDTTETTIELIYESAINTIFLGNCNFENFKIEISKEQEELTTTMDKDHGRYNTVVRLLPITGITTFKIIIPAQSTVNGESFFAIGSIVAGTRVELTAKPQYPVAKTLIENIFEKRFDGQNREVQEIGRPYHLLEFNWNGIDEDYFDEIEDVIREMGQDGIGIVHEKWDDYEASYLCQLNGDFPFSRIKDFYAHQISFREII